METRRYDPVTQLFHWSTMLAVVAAYAIGLYREGLPKDDFRAYLMSLHMSAGLLVMGLTAARIAWRSVVPAPTPVAGPITVKLAAKAGHLALYAAMAAIPLIGLLAAWAKARDITFFGLFPIPAPIRPDRQLVGRLEDIHAITAHVMMILAGLHAAAAMIHQFAFKDGTMARMLPSGRALEPAVQD